MVGIIDITIAIIIENGFKLRKFPGTNIYELWHGLHLNITDTRILAYEVYGPKHGTYLIADPQCFEKLFKFLDSYQGKKETLQDILAQK
jgi:hypothetical protein